MKTALLLQYTIRNDITFESTSKSCVTRMAGQDTMLYPGAFAFVCLASTCLQTHCVNILADLTMKDSHSPAEYIQMRLSLFQDSHILSKAHPDAIPVHLKSYSPMEYLLPS